MSSYTIGYANQTLKLSFIVSVWESFLAAAAQHPDVRVVMRDNEMDTDKALANMQEFADLDVNMVITCHVDERTGLEVVKPLRSKNIPIISLEIPIPFTTFFGIDNHKAGVLLGSALGEWVQKHWGGEFDKVLMMGDYRITGIIRKRFDLTVESLLKVVPLEKDNVLTVHSGNIREIAAENAYPVLKTWGKSIRTVIIGGNDDTGMGALDAAIALGLQENVVVGGHGATLALEEFEKPDSRFVATTAFYPENYGQPMMDIAMRMMCGEKVPAQYLMPPKLLKHENF